MKRRQSRELALKLLYATELSKSDSADSIKRHASFEKVIDPEVHEYALKIVAWTLESYNELEKQLKLVIKNWSMDRLTKIDKTLIYMGCAEIKQGGQAPAVVINELVELAKQYGDKESASFVNGVIDAWVKMR